MLQMMLGNKNWRIYDMGMGMGNGNGNEN